MKECNKCGVVGDESCFYARDNTCKECRKARVRQNRADKIDYYRAYDRARANRPDRVAARRAYRQTEAGIEALKKASQRYLAKNPVKRAAAVILGNAVRDGKVQKPVACSNCGSVGRIHGHHDNYARPLEVRWLCSKCHRAWHKEHGEGANG